MAKTHSSAAVRRAPAACKARKPKAPCRPTLVWTNPTPPLRKEVDCGVARFVLNMAEWNAERRGRPIDLGDLTPAARRYWMWRQAMEVRNG